MCRVLVIGKKIVEPQNLVVMAEVTVYTPTGGRYRTSRANAGGNLNVVR